MPVAPESAPLISFGIIKKFSESETGWLSVLSSSKYYNPGQNYLRICTPPCTLSNATILFQQQLICVTKSPSPQVNVVSYKCLRIRVALEHTTTLLPRGGGKGGRGIARMLGKTLWECDIFSTVLSKIVADIIWKKCKYKMAYLRFFYVHVL